MDVERMNTWQKFLFWTMILLSLCAMSSFNHYSPQFYTSIMLTKTSMKNDSADSFQNTSTSLFIQLSKKMPYPVSASLVFNNGTDFFLFGGTNDSWDAQPGVYMIDTQLYHNWTKIGDLPYAFYNAGMAHIGSMLYFIGGFNNGTWINNITTFNLRTLQFKVMNVTLPAGLELPTVATVNDTIYIFGGSNPYETDLANKVYTYNIRTNNISVLPVVMPAGLKGPAVASVGGTILLIGGQYSNTSQTSQDIWSFNIQNEQFIKKEETLPEPMILSDYSVVNDNLYVFSTVDNNNVPHNTILMYDLTNFTTKTFVNLTTEINQTYFSIGISDMCMYFFGGVKRGEFTGLDTITQVDFTAIQDTSRFTLPFDNQSWKMLNNQSFQLLNAEHCLNWSFTPQSNYATTNIHDSVVNGDEYSLETTYYQHFDPNTRQAIQIGWTDTYSFLRSSPFSDYPSKNFIGISISNFVVSSVQIHFYIIKNGNLVSNKEAIVNANSTHIISYNVVVLNSTHFLQQVIIDGQTRINETSTGNMNQLTTNYFSLWNQQTSSLPTQGQYTGEVAFASIKNIYATTTTNSSNPSSNYLATIMTLLVWISVFLILIGTIGSAGYFVVNKTRLRYYLPKQKIPGVSTVLVPSVLYSIYIALKRSFTRLEQIQALNEVDAVEDTEIPLDTTKTTEDKNQNAYSLIPLSEVNLEGLTGISIKILINLLNQVDYKSYLSTILVDLNIGKSTAFYALNKLEELGYIEKKVFIQEDMRKKVLVLTPNGLQLLQKLYMSLKKYYEN